MSDEIGLKVENHDKAYDLFRIAEREHCFPAMAWATENAGITAMAGCERLS